MEELSLVKKGKECYALAQSVCSDVNNISFDDVEQKLTTLRGYAKELSMHAEERAMELEEVGKRYIKEVEETQRRIGELGVQEETLTKQKSELESTLSGKQTALSQMRQTLSNAEDELKTAETRARIYYESTNLGAGAIAAGALAGTVLAPGIGTAVGGVAGLAIAGVGAGLLATQSLHDQERKLDEYKRRCEEAELDVQHTQREMHVIENKITLLTSQCTSLNHDKQQYIDKVKEMKEAVVFFQKAAQFWKELQQATEEADGYTVHMKAIVSKAEEKQDMKWLTSDGNIVLGVSFVKAWEIVETKCANSTGYKFQRLTDKDT